MLSGFLITSIILKQLASGKFSFVQFYLQRAQRLFPALFTTVAITFIFAAFILFPDDFQRFAKSSIATVLSVSNVLFWSESGYWDVSSDSKVLLHTWSLGVEEQFYLLWPAVLFAMHKLSLPRLKFFIILTVVAILVSYWWSKNDLSGAFYLLPARVFQFSSGAVLAVFVGSGLIKNFSFIERGRNVIFIIGLFLIVASNYYLDEKIDYPGLYALLPTVGALLVILAGSSVLGQGSLGQWLLENKASIWIGRISYSLYLVHWPVIVLYCYLSGPELVDIEVLSLFVVIFVLGAALHYGVERRFYQHRFISTKEALDTNRRPAVLKALFVFWVFIISVSLHAWLNGGWEWRFKNITYSADMIKSGEDKRFYNYRNACLTSQWLIDERCSKTTRTVVLFLGNSHEPDGFNFMSAAYPSEMTQARLFNFGTINECSDLERRQGEWKSSNKHCQDRLDGLFLRGLASRIDVIVYSAHHTFMPWNFKPLEFVRDIKGINPSVKVVVIGDYVETKTPCVRIKNNTQGKGSCFAEDNIAYHARKYKEQELYPKYQDLINSYIDQLELLCPSSDLSSCQYKTNRNVIFSYDNHHKSLEFSEMAGRIYGEAHPEFWGELLLLDN